MCHQHLMSGAGGLVLKAALQALLPRFLDLLAQVGRGRVVHGRSIGSWRETAMLLRRIISDGPGTRAAALHRGL